MKSHSSRQCFSHYYEIELDALRTSENMRRLVVDFACTLSAIAMAIVVGCGESRTNIGRVEGIVRLDGKPLTGGKIQFLPTAGRSAIAEIQSDGTFTLGTYGNSDGALIGTHKVAVIAYEPGPAGRPDPAKPRAPLKPLVPERYLAAGTSGLTYEVKPGMNSAEFDLTSP